MAEPLSARMAAWIKENEGKHICKCGCGQPVKIQREHHSRGIPTFFRGHSRRGPPHDRFWEKVARAGPDECWLWTAARDRRGYGHFSIKNAQAGAHRVSWELHNGPIPAGLFVCHRCDWPRCVNPAHLFLGTAADNNADMVAKGRQSRGARHADKIRGEKSGAAKLTEAKVRDIMACSSKGASLSALSVKHGVTNTTVWRVVHGKAWRHVLSLDAPPPAEASLPA